MPLTQVRGTRINIEQAGSGPPLVLLHGLADESDTWLTAIAALSGSFTLVRYDFPGHGLSSGEPPVDQGSLTALVAGLDALLDHLGLPSAHLAGHDLGGAVLQRLACEQPERARSLILEGTLPAPLAEPTAALEPGRTVDVPGRTALEPAPVGGTVVESVSGGDGIRRLAAIAGPTLVLVGEEDAWPFQEGAELLHGWIPNSRLVRIPHAGHTPHREQPGAFAAHVRAFLVEHERCA